MIQSHMTVLFGNSASGKTTGDISPTEAFCSRPSVHCIGDTTQKALFNYITALRTRPVLALPSTHLNIIYVGYFLCMVIDTVYVAPLGKLQGLDARQ